MQSVTSVIKVESDSGTGSASDDANCNDCAGCGNHARQDPHGSRILYVCTLQQPEREMFPPSTTRMGKRWGIFSRYHSGGPGPERAPSQHTSVEIFRWPSEATRRRFYKSVRAFTNQVVNAIYFPIYISLEDPPAI